MTTYFHISVATSLLCLVATAALPQSSVTMAPSQMKVLEEYRAFIGRDDLYNSSGSRLTKPWEVLRQDRANLHQFGTMQNHEDGDTFFGNSENRAKMESMLSHGFISQEAGDAIVNGLVWVKVQILGNGTIGKAIRISVQR